MKIHTTVKITRRMLTRLHACPRGTRKVEKLLPAEISTDPEQNYKLAIELVELDDAWDDSHWLAVETIGADGVPSLYCTDGYSGGSERDPYVVAQRLAWVADAIATKRGR